MDRCPLFAKLCLPLLLIAMVCGCEPSDSNTSGGGGQSNGAATVPDDGVAADQILTLMRAVYANAKNYSDNGKLLLSYRKDGLLTEEPQRWSTTWSADGKLAMEIFGAHVKGDSQRLSCYIYDIDSANLDGQRMLVPYENGQPPVEKVFRDPIARVFLGGYSELPLNEVDQSLREKLIPAPLSLLTGKLPCVWLQSPTGIERLPDETLGGHECYVLRSLAEGMGCDIWIDRSTGLLVQMSLPLKLLDPQVMAAPNITDLRMLAQFENAAINTALDPETFQLQVRKNSTPVRTFVTLPEALPVESVGLVVDRFRLTQPDGKTVDHLHFDGKPTALLWLGGENSYTAIKRLDAVANRLPADQFNFGIVYSDSELAGAPSQPDVVVPELTAAMASSDVSMFYDPRLAASTELAIRDLPSVVLMDGDSRVQFAASVVGDAWADDLEVAMKRVAAGENLADEMLNQYQAFMTGYKNALTRVDASPMLPSHLSPKAAGDPAGVSSLPVRNTRPALVARRKWISRDFKQPGNISVSLGRQARIVVLDGLRTIVELDENGKTISSGELDLPAGVGVSRIRSTLDGRWHVLFSPLTRNAFVFDNAWRPDPVYTQIADRLNAPITDICLQEEPSGNAFLIVATKDSGAVLVSLDGGEKGAGMVEDLRADSMVLNGRSAAFVQNGILKSRPFANGSVATKAEQSYRFNRVSKLAGATAKNIFATGFDGSQWKAVCLDDKLGTNWESPIGSQLFESLIDPIAAINSRDETGSQEASFAIATTQNAIHIFDSRQGWLADVRVSETPTGVALSKLDGGICLLVSVGSNVECWALE